MGFVGRIVVDSTLIYITRVSSTCAGLEQHRDLSAFHLYRNAAAAAEISSRDLQISSRTPKLLLLHAQHRFSSHAFTQRIYKFSRITFECMPRFNLRRITGTQQISLFAIPSYSRIYNNLLCSAWLATHCNGEQHDPTGEHKSLQVNGL